MGQKIDWNDYFVKHGADKTRELLLAALAQPAAITAPEADLSRDNPPPVAVSRQGFEDELNAAAGDFDRLLTISKSLQLAPLDPAEIEALLRRASKMMNVSIATLRTKKPAAKADKGAESSPPVRETVDYVDELNQKHAVVPLGGRVFIMNREFDPAMERLFYTFSGKADFQLRYANRRVWGEKSMVCVADAWLEHPERAQYEGIVFSPGLDIDGYFNLFKGFGVAPVQGDCQKFKSFIYRVVCSGNKELSTYLWHWLAHLFQMPNELPGTAIVLRGGQGTGKNTFVNCLGKLVGAAHFIELSSIQQVVGRFSGHLADKLLVFANEAIWGGDKSSAGTLKHIITDTNSSVEYKGKDIVSVKNYKRLLAVSNEGFAVPRDADDRRWVVIDISRERQEDQEYFAAIQAELSAGGYAALMYDLLHTDLSEFNPRRIPEQLRSNGWELKIQSGGSVLQWWFSVLNNGRLCDGAGYADSDEPIWQTRIKKTDVEKHYLAWCNLHKIAYPEIDCVIGKFLREQGVGASRPRQCNRQPHYELRPLKEHQEIFSGLMSIPVEHWSEGETD